MPTPNKSTPPSRLEEELRQSIDDLEQPKRATQDAIACVKTVEVKLPKLSQASLLREAYAHFNRALKDGQPMAQDILKRMEDVPRDQRGEAIARQREWIGDRCVAFLKAEIVVL